MCSKIFLGYPMLSSVKAGCWARSSFTLTQNSCVFMVKKYLKYLKLFSASNNTYNTKIENIINAFKQVSVFVSSQKPNVFSAAGKEKGFILFKLPVSSQSGG